MASQAAIAHPVVINLDASLVLPFLCFECLGVAELLPAPTRPILPPTDEATDTPAKKELDLNEGYVDIVQMSEIPKAFGGEEKERPIDWFCNKETNCDIMPLGSEQLRDIKIWNWGQARVTDTQNRQRNPVQGTAVQTPRSIALPNAVPVHKSLLHALRFALFGSRFDSKTAISDLFNHLEGIAWGYTRYLIHVLDMKKLFQTGRPISHVFLDVIASVTFMKDLAKMDGSSNKETELARFWAERQTIWKGKLGSSDICYLLTFY